MNTKVEIFRTTQGNNSVAISMTVGLLTDDMAGAFVAVKSRAVTRVRGKLVTVRPATQKQAGRSDPDLFVTVVLRLGEEHTPYVIRKTLQTRVTEEWKDMVEPPEWVKPFILQVQTEAERGKAFHSVRNQVPPKPVVPHLVFPAAQQMPSASAYSVGTVVKWGETLYRQEQGLWTVIARKDGRPTPGSLVVNSIPGNSSGGNAHGLGMEVSGFPLAHWERELLNLTRRQIPNR